MLLISYLLKRKIKFFLLYFAIHRHNEGVVTYGIRAGSTRDLGFATAFVDMSGFYLPTVRNVFTLAFLFMLWAFFYTTSNLIWAFLFPHRAKLQYRSIYFW
jgi:hypothetical protein